MANPEYSPEPKEVNWQERVERAIRYGAPEDEIDANESERDRQ